MEAFTPRNVAKYAVYAAVQHKTTKLTQDALDDYTSIDPEENFSARIGCNVVGWFVADKLKPHTDKLVDKTADFIATKRANRAAKKNTEEK